MALSPSKEIQCSFCPDKLYAGNSKGHNDVLDEHNSRHEHLTFGCLICKEAKQFGVTEMFVTRNTIESHLSHRHNEVYFELCFEVINNELNIGLHFAARLPKSKSSK